MKSDDIALIQRILAGDENAFVSLVEKYQKQVHALAWRKIGDFHIAEEITQDTFLKVYQKLSTLKNPHQFSGWLYVIATNQCRAWLRKKRIETESLEKADVEMVKEAYSRYVAEEQAKATTEAQRKVVKKLLAKLKESERTVMTLHYLGEMTVDEISRFLGVSASAIKLRLHRARQRLKKEEPMIREALSNFQLSPNISDNILQKVRHLKPAAPSGSKPVIPWVIGASSALLILLILGLGSQYLARFQKPYSLDSQSELAVELIETPVVLNREVKPDIRNQFGQNADDTGKGNGTGQESNQVISDKGDYTQWGLPENAKARLGKGSIKGISVSPDNTQIAVASATGVWIYNTQSGKEQALLTDHITLTNKVTYSSDGKTLATGSHERILLWDISSGKLLKYFKGHDARLVSLRFFGNGKTLLSVYSDDTACLWDFTSGRKLKEIVIKSRDLLSDTSREGLNGRLINIIKKLNHTIGHQSTVSQLYVSNHNKNGIFANGYENGIIRLEDATTGKHLKTLKNDDDKDSVVSLVFSPNGKLIAVGHQSGLLKLWDITTGQLLKTLSSIYILSEINESPTFSKDGKTLACQAKHGDIELWDITTRTLHVKLKGILDKTIHVLAFSPEGQMITGANLKGEIRIWNTATGNELLSFRTTHINGVPALKYSSDSKTIASEQGGTIQLWDALNFTQKSKSIHIKTWGPAIVFSQGGRTMTIGEEFRYKKHSRGAHAKESLIGKVSLWNTSTGNKLYDFSVESHTGELPKLPAISKFTSGIYGRAVFSHNGNMFAVPLNSKRASKENQFSIHLWKIWENPINPSHITHKDHVDITFKGHTAKINALVFTQDGKTLASGSDDGTIRIWDTSTGTEISSLPLGKTRTFAFSVDGIILASGIDRTIQLWDVPTKTQMKTLELEANFVSALAISPDNKILASGSHNGVIHLLHIATGNKLSTLQGHTDTIDSLEFSSDGETLASSSYDGAIFLWDLKSIANTNQHPQ